MDGVIDIGDAEDNAEVVEEMTVENDTEDNEEELNPDDVVVAIEEVEEAAVVLPTAARSETVN